MFSPCPQGMLTYIIDEVRTVVVKKGCSNGSITAKICHSEVSRGPDLVDLVRYPI